MNMRGIAGFLFALLLATSFIGSAYAARGSAGGGRGGSAHGSSAHSGSGHSGGYGAGGYRNHGRTGVLVGGSLFAFGYPFAIASYYGPYGYFDTYPPYLPDASQPPVYIEMPGAAPMPQKSTTYWYYCSDPPGYYPYLQNCPGGWQQVAPFPSQGAY